MKDPEKDTQKNFLQKNSKTIYIILLSLLALLLLSAHIPGCANVSGLVTPPVALFCGLAFALLCGQPYPTFNSKMSKYLLQYSVVGLGFGMNVESCLQSGSDGMLFTIASVIGTMIIGWLIGRKVLKVDTKTSYLISSGTAICGGSAIAAVGPVVKADNSQMSVALVTVFVLNAVALFIFPPIGHALDLSQKDFATWAAIAIHDTSSVVGAGAAYGDESLEIATTIKLTRALWIIPLALVTSFIFKAKGQKVKVPLFIILFICAILINTYLLSQTLTGACVGNVINLIARKFLTLSLFFIGASLTRQTLMSVGLKPMLQGVILWVVISLVTLAYILI